MQPNRLIIYKPKNSYSVLNWRIKIQIYQNANRKYQIYKKIQRNVGNVYKNRKMILMRLREKRIRLKRNYS